MGEIFHLTPASTTCVWLGGLVFTTFVVSPALKAMNRDEAERVAVRSAIGRQYARVGSVNLGLLLLFAVLDGVFGGFGADLYAEYALLLVLFGFVAANVTGGGPLWLCPWHGRSELCDPFPVLTFYVHWQHGPSGLHGAVAGRRSRIGAC